MKIQKLLTSGKKSKGEFIYLVRVMGGPVDNSEVTLQSANGTLVTIQREEALLISGWFATGATKSDG